VNGFDQDSWIVSVIDVVALSGKGGRKTKEGRDDWQPIPPGVRDRATFEQPHQYAEGVTLVVVNGEVVFENGAMTGKRPGRVLSGPARAR
jgi:hypothetical protein